MGNKVRHETKKVQCISGCTSGQLLEATCAFSRYEMSVFPETRVMYVILTCFGSLTEFGVVQFKIFGWSRITQFKSILRSLYAIFS